MSTLDPPMPDVPHVLLFGHRGSGKSALIGALLQSGETQGETLRGEVVSSSVDLPRIREATYSGKLESASTELSSFTIRLRPWRVGTQPLMEPLTVVLDDCDGKAAGSLLAHPDPLTHRAPGSPLARAVVETDTIMLLVNASSTRDELEAAFKEFDKFLSVVERLKADARAVGGFPIFLVLTQCDRLSQHGDSQQMWEARVKDRIDYAGNAFAEYLKEGVGDDDTPSPFLAFGSVDLDVFAVAIRRPTLTEQPTPGDQPYQVAELFRNCFAGAKAHHERVYRSEVQLWWTVRIAFAAVSFLLFTLGLITLFPPEASGPDLSAKVDDYRQLEKTAARRLADGERDRNKRVLARFASDGAFPSLSVERREFVTSRLKEIDDYDAYSTKLANAIAPAAVRRVDDKDPTVPDLASVRKTLLTDLALPAEYSWGETDAAELRDKWLADCTAIEAAQQAIGDWYRVCRRTGTALTLKRSFDEGWLKEIDALFATAELPPFPLHEPIPGSPVVNQARGTAVTYEAPFEFDEVDRARNDWKETQQHLAHLRDLADALGTTGPNRPDAVLVLPEPNGTDSASLATTRLATLARTYPRLSTDYSDWDARGELVGRAQKSFATATRHFQRLLAVKDTAEGWTVLAAELADPKYRDWGKLLQLLGRLEDPSKPDPVADLTKFLHDLNHKSFDLHLQGFELSIPLDLTFDRVEVNGRFTVTVTHANQLSDVAKFTLGKGVIRKGPVRDSMVYALAPEGNTKLAYRAGDGLRAELPVKVGTRDLRLVWDRGPTNTFQFDRLGQEPRLTKATGGAELAPGVVLTLTAGSVPKFPVLMPPNK